MNYVVDTHALLWYLFDPNNLPERVDNLMTGFEMGKNTGLIPTIVLAELQFLFDKQKKSIKLKELTEEIESKPGFRIISFDRQQVLLLDELKAIHEMHDRIIVATARQHKAKIITKDRDITNYAGSDAIW
jgi:PIN domain nuclease of toxin-antitoxin system